ncbi:hypothetical protein V2O64_04110 [Verrucomicrobiaceae bacterium 227]
MVLRLVLFLALLLPLHSQEGWLTTPVRNSSAVNQLRTSGNACGPACLLDAFQSGSKKWQASVAKIEGDSDTQKIIGIIKSYGKKGSQIDPKRARWNTRQGVSAQDLVNMANEMRTGMWMGTVKQALFFPKGREASTSLLQSTHRSLTKSLKKGLPPILSIRRVALRSPSRNTAPSWLTVKRHFVVLTGLPAKLPKNASSFRVTYHDPWGGKKCQGIIKITDHQTRTLGTLIADFPESKIGRDLIRRGEATELSLSSAIGLF